MLKLFRLRWDAVPTTFLDTETTGIRPGIDRAVSVGLARFEGGKCVATEHQLVNPGIPIPAEATAIHGITDAEVRSMPSIEVLFRQPMIQQLLEGATPGAFNGPFDRHFIPPFGEDWTWPWLDTLSLVRFYDRYEKDPGRHKLAAACLRHGIELNNAHSAGDDARAAGELFYKLVPLIDAVANATLGELLRRQRVQDADEWYRFSEWLSRQPPREATP